MCICVCYTMYFLYIEGRHVLCVAELTSIELIHVCLIIVTFLYIHEEFTYIYMHIYRHTHAKIMFKWYLDLRFYLHFTHTHHLQLQSIQFRLRLDFQHFG